MLSSSIQHTVTLPKKRMLAQASLRKTTVSSAANTYHILNYKYVPDILEKRGPYRNEHLENAKIKAEAGKVVMVGATGAPVDGAVFIFRNSTPEEIEKYAKADPYVVNGLVPSYTIKPYTVVVGNTI
uniref:YCII-related domain-containing protein n=1 Tax=Polytomella parva TaxID=51329 RepID=A0A7S0V6G9_9CHLO|mmetsp:Transcript_31312/g.56827  ORF Transcript_31312/g.56827 Transcript_31312/m.56827 type:complete len:127 (+) Transcript_31312:17-397(+)